MTDPARWPAWLDLVVLALAAFRVARLVGWDDLTAGARARLLLPDAEYWQAAKWISEVEKEGGDPWDPRFRVDPDVAVLPSRRRFYLAKLAHCPWCGGFWISLAAWLAWLAAPSDTLYVAGPLALSALLGLIAKKLDP